VDHGRTNVIAAKRLLDSPDVVPTFQQMRKRPRSFDLRVPVPGCWEIFGTLGSRPAGPSAMTPCCLSLAEEMTIMVRRPCCSGRSGCAQFQGYVSPFRIAETGSVSRCFPWRETQGGMETDGIRDQGSGIRGQERENGGREG
jgi:hypothetical protein